jgi:hypothetical protein
VLVGPIFVPIINTNFSFVLKNVSFLAIVPSIRVTSVSMFPLIESILVVTLSLMRMFFHSLIFLHQIHHHHLLLIYLLLLTNLKIVRMPRRCFLIMVQVQVVALVLKFWPTLIHPHRDLWILVMLLHRLILPCTCMATPLPRLDLVPWTSALMLVRPCVRMCTWRSTHMCTWTSTRMCAPLILSPRLRLCACAVAGYSYLSRFPCTA